MQDVEEEIPDPVDRKRCRIAVLVKPQVVALQQLGPEAGGRQQKMILELVHIQQVGSQHLADDRIAAKRLLHLFVNEFRRHFVGRRVEGDLSRIRRLRKPLVQGAQVGKAEVVKPRIRRYDHLLDRKSTRQQQVDNAGNHDRRRVERPDDRIGQIHLLRGKDSADNDAVHQLHLIGIDAPRHEGIVQRHGLGIDVRVEQQPRLGGPRHNRIGRADGLPEGDVPPGFRVDIQLELGENRSLDLQVPLLDLQPMAVDRPFDNRVALENDVAVQLGNGLRKDRPPDEIVLQQYIRFVETYLFQFLHDYRLFMVEILNMRVMHSFTRLACGSVEA